ncbi:rhoptry neck protein RON8 [Besnoitia besnoiti]|uniref:Rhoptry neck protein RON8 n=1 Tax=Besnoitia besnoiti TaxID=94643 RepID=A0A2A9MA56_BESBE|nr:rhoptry neck protein RON8 [Besnoitia besnoiti]PFH32497.1 rhoptry neck protein RON8 [Besnoitia besnoiti]
MSAATLRSPRLRCLDSIFLVFFVFGGALQLTSFDVSAAGHYDAEENPQDDKLAAFELKVEPDSSENSREFVFTAEYVHPSQLSNVDDDANQSFFEANAQGSPGKFDPTSPTEELRDVQLRVTSQGGQQGHYAEIVVFKEGEVVAGFRFSLQQKEQVTLLQQLAKLSNQRGIHFAIEWRGRGDGSGSLYIRTALHLLATGYKPSVHFDLILNQVGPGGAPQTVKFRSNVPIDDIKVPGASVGALKQLIADHADPGNIVTGAGSFTIKRLYAASGSKNAVTDEGSVMPWLLRMVGEAAPLRIRGELIRNMEFSMALPQGPANWSDILRLYSGMEDAAKRGKSAREFTQYDPGYQGSSLFLPPDGFKGAARLDDHQPDRLQRFWQQGGESGMNPGEIGHYYRTLFGRHYDTSNNPLLLLDMYGNPVYSPGGLHQFTVGPGQRDPKKLPDHLSGMVLPGIRARFEFADSHHSTEFVNPARPWDDITKGWDSLSAKHKLRINYREPGLTAVSVNGVRYGLDQDFKSRYPTLLHLLASLSHADPDFALDSVVFHFGDQLPTLFVLDDAHDRQIPWCAFEYVIPLTPRGTVNIRTLMAKGKAATESPKGCNFHEKGFRFTTVHRWGFVDSRTPLSIDWKGVLDYRGSKEECSLLGKILKDAHLSGRQIALSFHAEHKATFVPVLEKFGPDGKPTSSKGQKPVTTTVQYGEDLDGIIFDLTKPFQKKHIPTMMYPFLPSDGHGQPPRDALNSGILGPEYYHRPPKSRVTLLPEIPILNQQDTFYDGTGPHHSVPSLTIPITTGPQQYVAPLKALRNWLNAHYPGSKLPFNLSSMSDDDLQGIADFLLFRFDDGREVPLRSIFGPEVFSPNWAAANPGAYSQLLDILTKPKNMLLAKNFRIVVTGPDGRQTPFDIRLEPGDTWQKTLDIFFKTHPNVKPQDVKLVLYDDRDTPLREFDVNMDIYSSSYTEAVDQLHMKGLQITLETPAPIVSCYQEDPKHPKKCLAVDMKRIFCGRVIPAKMRSRQWNAQCNPEWIARADPQTIEDNYVMGPDDVRARSIRDLLISAKNDLKKRNPEIARTLKIPVSDAAQSAELNRKLQERSDLMMKSGKTLEELDQLRRLKMEIKLLQRQGELQWARLTGATIVTTENGKPVERHIKLDPKQFFMPDKLWKVYKALARVVPGLKFENVFNFSFEVMDEGARMQWKAQQAKAAKAAKEKMKAQRTLVDVVFIGPDGAALFTDMNVELRQLSDEALGRLSKGDRKGLMMQLAKLYGIPKHFFIRRGGYPLATVSGVKWVIVVMLGLVGGPDRRGLAPLLDNPQAFIELLQKQGGFQPTDYVTLVFFDGRTTAVSLSALAQEDLSQLSEIYFPWRKGSGQALEEKKKAVETKAAEASGIMRTVQVTVTQPSSWPSVFGAWLSDLHEMDLFDDGPVMLKIRPEGAQKGQTIRCTVKTLGEIYQALNNPELIRRRCPGLGNLNEPFTVELSVRTAPEQVFRLYNRSRSPDEQRKTASVLPKLKFRIRGLPADGQVTFEYRKKKQDLTPQQLQQLKALIEGLRDDEPSDAIMTQILRLLGFSDEDIAKGGRLRFWVKQAPTSSEKQMLREGSLTAVVEDLQGGRRKKTVPLSTPENEGIKLGASAQQYYIHFSLFSKKTQQMNAPCGSKTGAQVASATWGQLCRWCDLKFAELPGLGNPTVYIRIIASDKAQTVRGGQPVTTTIDGHPVVYDVRLPGDPRSASGLPGPIFWNMVERPGPNDLGPIWHQSAPQPGGGLRKDYNYMAPNPRFWGANLFGPSSGAFPKDTRAGIDVVTHPDPQESGAAYTPPIKFGFGFTNWKERDNMRSQFNNMAAGLTPEDQKLYKVYIQVPKGDGPYYACKGIDIKEFMRLSREQVAQACGVDPALLDAPFGVYLLKETPTYAPNQSSFPVFLIDPNGDQHPSVGQWTGRPANFLGPLLKGSSPASILQFEFAPGVTCNLTQQEVMKMQSWEELLLRCNLNTGKERPASITARIVPMYATPNVTFHVPNELLAPVLKAHGNIQPEQFFRQKTTQEIVTLLLANAQLGLYYVGLRFSDGSEQSYSELPEHLRDLPPSQIPGLKQIFIVPASGGKGFHPGVFRGGSLGDLMKSLHMSPDTSYKEFVRRVGDQLRSPEGLKIPGIPQHIGGKPAPGQSSTTDFDFAVPEGAIGPGGQSGGHAAWRPGMPGTFPDDMPMGEVEKQLHHPYMVFTTRHTPTYDIYGIASLGGPSYHEQVTRLDAHVRGLVEWMKNSVGIADPNGVIGDLVVDSIRCPAPMTAGQLLFATVGHLLHHCGVTDFQNSHSLYVMATAAPGFTAVPRGHGPNIVINGHNYGAPAAAPRDFSQLFSLPGGHGQPLAQDVEISVTPGAGQQPVRGVLPHDLFPWLQAISDKHGEPGVSVVLNFLRQLHSLANLPPGASLNIETKLIPPQNPQQLYPPGQVPQPGPWLQGMFPTGGVGAGGVYGPGGAGADVAGGAGGPPVPSAPPAYLSPTGMRLPLLRQPSVELPRNSMLRGSVGGVGGVPKTEFVIPILPSQKSMPVEQVLKFFGISPASVQNLDVQEKPETGSIMIKSGGLTFVPLKGAQFTIAMTTINPSDPRTLAQLLTSGGHSVSEVIAGAEEDKPLVLKIVIEHGAATATKVTTPVGTPKNAISALQGLSLWKLLPPLIQVPEVETIVIRVKYAKEFQEAANAAAAAKEEAAEAGARAPQSPVASGPSAPDADAAASSASRGVPSPLNAALSARPRTKSKPKATASGDAGASAAAGTSDSGASAAAAPSDSGASGAAPRSKTKRKGAAAGDAGATAAAGTSDAGTSAAAAPSDSGASAAAPRSKTKRKGAAAGDAGASAAAAPSDAGASAAAAPSDAGASAAAAPSDAGASAAAAPSDAGASAAAPRSKTKRKGAAAGDAGASAAAAPSDAGASAAAAPSDAGASAAAAPSDAGASAAAPRSKTKRKGAAAGDAGASAAAAPSDAGASAAAAPSDAGASAAAAPSDAGASAAAAPSDAGASAAAPRSKTKRKGAAAGDAGASAAAAPSDAGASAAAAPSDAGASAAAAPSDAGASAAAAPSDAGASAAQPESVVKPKISQSKGSFPPVFHPRPRAAEEIDGTPNSELSIFVDRQGESTQRYTLSSRIRGSVVGEATVNQMLDLIDGHPFHWYRIFWGQRSVDGSSCKPRFEFPYHHWLHTVMAKLPVPQRSTCLLVREIVKLRIGEGATFFSKPHFFHNPVIIIKRPGEPKQLMYEEQIDPTILDQPLTTALEQLGVTKEQIASVQQCTSDNIDAPASCSSKPLEVNPETTVPAAVATKSAFLKVAVKKSPASFLQILRGRRRLSAA